MSQLPEGGAAADLAQPVAESDEEIAAWWTPERRRRARPSDDLVRESDGGAAAGETGPTISEPVRLVIGEPPGRRADGPAGTGEETERPEGEPEVGAPPVAITRAQIDFPPYVQIGQLFFQHGGQAWTGSAFVIGVDLVMTAAHNLYDRGTWSSAVMFVPAAWDGVGAFGSWSARTMSIPGGYVPDQPMGLDYAVLPMRAGGNNPNGPVSIGTAVGTLGYRTGGDPTGLSWADVGYPGNYGNADRMYAQVGDFTARLDGDAVVAMTGDFTQGASGGPWLLQQGQGGTVYGLHSGRRPARPGEVLSPYFSTAVGQFIDRHALAVSQVEVR